MYTMSGSWDDWMYGNRSTFALTCEIYTNNSAWQYEPGPEPDTLWEGGVFQFFNPDTSQIETVIQRWLPTFSYVTDRAITEAYNIATTNATPLKTVVGQGYSMSINATITNKGDFTETFNITLYTNTTCIATQSISLASKDFTTLTFMWNTSGFAKGNYTISAYAWPVPGETDTADNNFTGRWVIVSMVGDLCGTGNAWDFVPDGVVDGSDLAIVAKCYGSWPGAQPPMIWNANCDVTNDGVVDGSDLAIIAKHFGESDP
jgi:hypothetical protein